MYRLLIVDDDEMIRKGIKNAIPWAQHGISEVRTAEDGDAGEAVFAAFLPDIVLTDIRMPGMDGLELMERIKDIKNSVRVIILSGYDDFFYAQTALKQGAFDYLLKTADIEELLRVIDRAIEDIKKEREEDRTYRKLKQQLTMSLPLLRYRYLNELIHGSMDLDHLKKRMEFVDLKFGGDCFILTVAEIDDFELLHEGRTEEERLLSKFRVMNVIEELLGNQGLCFESTYGEIVCIYFCEDNRSAEENKGLLLQKCEAMGGAISRKLALSLSMGVSSIGYSFKSIKPCYEDAKKALEYKLYSGKGSIIDIRDISGYTSTSFSVGYELENRLISSIRVGDKKTALHIVEDVFDQIHHRRNLGVGNFRRVCIELLGLASMVLSEFEADFMDLYGKEFLYFEEVKKYTNVEDARSWMLLHFEKILDYIRNTRVLKAKKIIETAKQYIDENYNRELTLSKVADIVHMSPNYFSSLFSSEAGESFLEYVIQRRIEKAKILLGEKDAKAWEVGEKVGYGNPYYFSRIFKKYTGVSPMEYKKQVEGSGRE